MIGVVMSRLEVKAEARPATVKAGGVPFVSFRVNGSVYQTLVPMPDELRASIFSD